MLRQRASEAAGRYAAQSVLRLSVGRCLAGLEAPLQGIELVVVRWGGNVDSTTEAPGRHPGSLGAWRRGRRRNRAAIAVLWLVVRSAPVGLLFAAAAQQADVALLSPASSPGVLDQPVPLAALPVGAVALSKHSVAEDGVLLAAVEDARVVVKPVVSVDSHNHWALLIQGLHNRLSLIAREVGPARDANPLGGWPGTVGSSTLVWAGVGVGVVRIIALGRNPVVADESIGQLASCTFATAASTAVLRVWDAVHQTLRGELQRPVRLAASLQLRLESFDGTYGPAAATVALITDLRSRLVAHTARDLAHSGLAAASQAVQATSRVELQRAKALGARLAALVAVHGRFLGLRVVHERVDASLPEAALLLVLCVDSLDALDGFLEDLLSLPVLSRSHAVRTSILPGELQKGVVAHTSRRLTPTQRGGRSAAQGGNGEQTDQRRHARKWCEILSHAR